MNPSEIWEFKGPNWTLPISVEIHEECAFVRPATVALLRRQQWALNEALSQIAISGDEQERMVPLVALQENAIKSTFDDPEAVVVWNRRPIETPNLDREPGVDEFVGDWLMNAGLSISKAAATTFYISICTHMVHWLVNRRKPVNLMFGQIDPFQMRRNWKEIAMGKAAVRYFEEDQVWPNITYISGYVPTPGELCVAESVAFEDGVCNWSLEFTPSKWFHQHSREVEVNRKRRLGGNYLVSVCRTIMSQVERAQATYRKYLNEIAPKIVQLPKFDVGDSGYFTSFRKHSNKRTSRPVKAFVLPPDLARDFLEARLPGDEEPEAGDLPQVPGVPRADGPVRETGENLGESANRPD